MYTKIDDNTIGETVIKKIDIKGYKERKEQIQKMIENLKGEIVEINVILDEAKKLGVN